MAYPYNRLLFSHKKEWNSDACYDMDDLWKHAKWKMPDTKGHVWYDCIYIKCPE